MITEKKDTIHNKGKLILFLLFAATTFSLAYYLGVHTSFIAQSLFNQWAYTLGVTFLVPIAYYFWIIRPYKISIISLLFVFLLSVAYGELVVPEAHKNAFRYLSYLLIFTEGLLVVLVAFKLTRITRALRAEFRSGKEYGFSNKFRKGIEEVLGTFHDNFLLTETAVFYYVFIAPFLNNEVPTGASAFSLHHKSNYTSYFILLLAIALPALLGLFFLLSEVAGSTTACIVTGCSFYGVLYLVADFVAIIKRPIIVRNNILYYYVGMRWTAEFPFDAIERVEKVSPKSELKNALNASLRKNYDVLITFKEKQEIRTLFAIKKSCRSMVITVDEPEKFIDTMRGHYPVINSNKIQKAFIDNYLTA